MKTQSLEEQSTKDYLEKIKNTHKDPYWMSYEVVQLKKQTVFSSDFYYEAFDVFKEYLEKDKQARLDLVVRIVKDGIPLFRTTILDLTFVQENSLSSYNGDEYGRYGYSVYNHTYKDSEWGGYECYSHPLKLFKYQEEI